MYYRAVSGLAFAALLVGQPIFAADAPVASLDSEHLMLLGDS